MKVVEQFKRRILDLAIRGKLVPQDPNDEPASVLLERIKAEKDKLVKAGKIKKEKNSSRIVIGSDGAAYGKFGSGDLSHAEARRRGEGWRTSSRAVTGGPTSVSSVNVPFEIPKGWAWCRISDVAKIITGATPRTSRRDFFDGDIPFIKPADIGINKNIGVTAETLTELGANQVRPIPANAVCVCCIGSLGKVGVASSRSCTNQQINSIVSSYLLSDFMYYIASSGYFTDTLKSLASAITIALVNKSRMATIPIPLPPLAEQKRIVARIEELFMVADLLGEAANKLEVTAKRLDKKILDLAIRGKLVQQDPNDEPASELVKRIAASHKSPSKNQSGPIDPPFDIPDSWEWVRLKELGAFCGGHTPSTSNPKLWGGDILWVSSKDMKSKYIDDTQLKVTRFGAEELNVLKPGALLMCTRSGILRRVFPIAIARRELTINQDQRALTLWLPEMIEYVYLALKSLESIILSDYKKSGTTVESIIWNKFVDLPIPLPPLDEQKRIVKRVEELKATTRTLVTF